MFGRAIFQTHFATKIEELLDQDKKSESKIHKLRKKNFANDDGRCKTNSYHARTHSLGREKSLGRGLVE